MATQADFERIGNYARMYNPDQNIDRRGAPRTVPLEVICPGYSRTGTLTVHKALTILGYPSFHFSSLCDNTLDSFLWVEAMDAKFNGIGPMPDKAFFDGVLGHISATTDAPCNFFTEELVNFYPDAKVVLVERDIDSWKKSWDNFCDSAYDPNLTAFAQKDPDFMGRLVNVGNYITEISAGFAMNKNQARVRSKAAYRHHYRDVREVVPKERLLEFRLADGWEFLGKPIPDVPFPHENDSQSNKQSFAELGAIAHKRIAAAAAAAAQH